MNLYLVGATFVVLVGLIALEACFAYLDGMLTPSQMISSGRPQGMPWVSHFGASWGDMCIVNTLVCLMMIDYGQTWTAHEWMMKFIISIVVTTVCHYLWSKNALPDCLACKGRLTMTGWVHAVYMTYTLTVISLFYFSTTIYIDPGFLIATSILLVFHITIGNHIQWAICRREWWPVTLPGLINAGVAIVGVSVALFFRCRHILAHQ